MRRITSYNVCYTKLLRNGIGTLIYLFLCQGKVPAFLGSSFAFLSPVFAVMAAYDYETALGGFIASGLIFIITSLRNNFV